MWINDSGYGNMRLSILGILGESAVCSSDWGTGQCSYNCTLISLFEQRLWRECLIREDGVSLDKEDENPIILQMRKLRSKNLTF